MVDWSLAVSVAVGVLAGVVAFVALAVAFVWVYDRIEKWREARKTTQQQTNRSGRQQIIAELHSQNNDLQRRLRESEVERRRLERLHQATRPQEQVVVEPVQVRSRYERLLASD